MADGVRSHAFDQISSLMANVDNITPTNGFRPVFTRKDLVVPGGKGVIT